MKKKSLFTILLTMLILSLTFVQVYGDNLNNLKNQQKNINSKLKQTKDQINSTHNQKKDVSQQIHELDLKLDNATVELENVGKQLDKLNNNIKKTTEELHDAEKKLDNKKDLFNKRVRVMYQNGNVGYLEVLLSSGNIKDFLSRKEMIQSIADHDKELIAYMKEQRDIINSKKAELEAQRASVEATKVKIEARKKDLEVATREKENLMSRLQKDIKEYEKAYDQLNEEAKAIESKIVKLQRNTGPYSGGKMGWPVPAGYTRISSPYGYRIHPIFKTKKLHTGIDIPVPTGTSVMAASDGVIIYSDWLGSYGKAVMVEHGGGIVTLYGHNSSLVAKVGQNVKRGETIAKAGSTGNSTGPHCHFEVRKNGVYVDPMPWFK